MDNKRKQHSALIEQFLKTQGHKNNTMNFKTPYINPFTDFGFKKLFGEEHSKAALISFLNDILPIEHKITNISFGNTEFLNAVKEQRKSVFDIYCTDEKNQHFIVELQNAKQEYFKDRTVFYSTFPIQKQAQKGYWNYKLEHVYCVGLLGFKFSDETAAINEEEIDGNEYLHVVKLKDQRNKIFYDKLTFVFVEFPKFNKTETDLVTHLDKWLYFFNNLAILDDIPPVLHEPIFEESFETARLANLTPAEREQYIGSFLAYCDNVNVVDYALQQGLEQGLEQGKEQTQREIAIKLLQAGVDYAVIATSTGLTVEQIKQLQK